MFYAEMEAAKPTAKNKTFIIQERGKPECFSKDTESGYFIRNFTSSGLQREAGLVVILVSSG